MKTLNIRSVSLLLTVGLLAVSLNGFSQEARLTRQEMKEVRKAQMEANYVIIDSLIKARKFVLVADFLSNQYGDRVVVTPHLNFIKLDDNNGVLQTGTLSGFGFNGVGGVTAEGTLGNWKVYKDARHQNFTLQFNLMTNIGIYDVSMMISSNTKARATITGLGRGKLTWEGYLQTIDNSRVFKGRNSLM